MNRKILTCSIVCLLCFIFCSLSANAQSTGIVKGTVVTSDGEPIESVSVGVKNTSQGSYTDEKGNFNITVASGNHTLLFSYLGSQSKEKSVNVGNGTIVDLGTITFDISSKALDEVVVDGMITKFAQKKSAYVARMPLKNLENPQVYTVVPKELLTEQMAIDFRSVLTSSPGVSSTTLGVGSGGTGMAMRLRGFAGANGAGAIRNGMATNYVSLSDPANLESIEIIKGPSGTLFGTNLISYGGLINRVTKKAHEGKSGEIGFSTGSFGLGRITADYNTPLDNEGKVLFRVNTALHSEKSFQDYGVNKTYMIAPTMTYNVNDRLTLTLDAEYFNSDRTTSYLYVKPGIGITDINQVAWDWERSYASNDVTSKAKVLNIFAEAKYKLSESWTSQTAVSYSRTDNDANYIFLQVNSAPDSINRQLMHIPSMFVTNQVQQNFIGDFKLGDIRNRILIGLDYTKLTTSDTRAVLTSFDSKSKDFPTGNIPLQGKDVPIYLDQYNLKMGTPNRTSANERFTRTYSAYASDVINPIEQLSVMASIRFDRFEDVQSDYLQTAWSPKFGVVYQFLKDKASVFANYMNGFKNQGPSIGNPDGDLVSFKPEHAFQWEGGFKLEFLESKLSGTISAYHIKVEDRIRSVAAPTGSTVTSYNVQDGTQVSKGVEVDFIANPIPGMHIIMGYGYNHNEFTKSSDVEGKRDYGTPKHLANFWISHKLQTGSLKGFGLGLGGNFASGHYLDNKNTINIAGYGKLDGSVFYEQSKFRIGVKLNNLTNKKYWLSDYYAEPQSSRQLIANITYRF